MTIQLCFLKLLNKIHTVKLNVRKKRQRSKLHPRGKEQLHDIKNR